MRSTHLMGMCLTGLLLCCKIWPASVVAQPREVAPLVAPVPEPSAWDRMIYVPYKNLDEAFDNPNATVVLPLAEYLDLWQKSQGARAVQAEAPVKAVIRKAEYRTTVEQNFARVQVTYSIQVLDKGWVELPVQFGEAAVGKLTVPEGKPEVLLRGTGNGTYTLLLPEAGEHEVSLELVQRIQTSPEGRSLDLTVPPVGIAEFSMTIPQPDQTVELLNGPAAMKTSTSDNSVDLPVTVEEGKTTASTPLSATGKISVRWYPKASLKPDMDLLASVNNTLRIDIKDQQIHTHASLQYEILRGELAEVEIGVPKGDRILDVVSPGATLKGWTTAEIPGGQLLKVEFLNPVEKSITLEVHTTRPQPQGDFLLAGVDGAGEELTYHGIHARNVVRESGVLTISHGKELALTVREQEELVRVEEAEIPEPARRPGALNYRFYSPGFTLKVEAQSVQPQIIAQQVTHLVFTEDELELQAVLNYQIDRIGVFSLSLEVPEDLKIDMVEGTAVKGYDFNEQQRRLTLSLTGEQQGQVTIQISGHRERTAPAENGSLSLPVLKPLNVTRETGTMAIYAPDSLEIITEENSLQGLYERPTERISRGNARQVSLWNYTQRPIALSVTTRRKPTRLSAKVGTGVLVRPEQVTVHTLIQFQVEHAGLDTFRFLIPKEFAGQVRFQRYPAGTSPAIKQQDGRDAEEAGWTVWTVVLQDKVLGSQSFLATYDLKSGAPPAAEEGVQNAANEPQKLVIQPIRVSDQQGTEKGGAVVNLASLMGELVVAKDQALSVASVSHAKALESIDLRELMFLTPQLLEELSGSSAEAVSLAYRYYQQPVSATLSATRHEIQPVLETVVSKALVEVILGQDPQATYRVRYRLKSSERQRLRIDLPKGMSTLGVLVDRKPSTLEIQEDAQTPEGWDAYSINVNRSGSADDEFSLTLLYMAPISQRPFEGSGGELALKLPKLGGVTVVEGNEIPVENIAVQQLRTLVWVPEDYVLVETPDRFTRLTRPGRGPTMGSLFHETNTEDVEQWIGVPTQNLLDFPTTGHHAYRYSTLGSPEELRTTWWQWQFYVWVLSGSFLLVGLVLLKTSWENKLGFLLLLGFLAAMVSLWDPQWVIHVVQAAQWGLLAMVLLWFIHGLLRSQTRTGSVEQIVPLTPERPPAAPEPVISPGDNAAVIPPPGIFEEWSGFLKRK